MILKLVGFVGKMRATSTGCKLSVNVSISMSIKIPSLASVYLYGGIRRWPEVIIVIIRHTGFACLRAMRVFTRCAFTLGARLHESVCAFSQGARLHESACAFFTWVCVCMCLRACAVCMGLSGQVAIVSWLSRNILSYCPS